MQHIAVTASIHPQHKDITVISVKGFIDTNTAPEFDRTFQAVLGENKFNIIIDLKETNYISSAGWGIFVGEIKRIRGQRGDLFLVGMSPEVIEAYELLQFSTILKSFPDVDQAILKGFKRTKPGKAGEKPQVDKGPEKAPENNSGEQNKMEKSFAGSGTNQAPKKPHWFFRILMPWTWF
jgi:anti-sigma B factor antagonist